MTQIIAMITHNFVTIVSDRRLSYLNEDGSFMRVKTDNECKLVSLCEHSCIAYTGLAELEEIATHKWIALTLKNHKCIDGWLAGKILSEESNKALIDVNKSYSHMTFLITGWKHTDKGLIPYMLRISNAYNHDESWNTLATNDFRYKLVYLLPDEILESMVVGVRLTRAQTHRLQRSLRKSAIERSLPSATLEFMSQEIIASSSSGSCMVGKKVLGATIPKNQRLEAKNKGMYFIGHHPPNYLRSTFTYYDENSDGLVVYGPTFICGNTAMTDFEGASERNGINSVSFTLL
ncbi:MAG: hypothetical protein AB2689_28050 [Candidatus Thiodiazotropha taylori]